MLQINSVTVVGVTGTMGANIAGIFASFGNAKVYCVGRDLEKVKKTIPRIVSSVRADSIAINLIAADYSMLEECVRNSDLVFESSAEDISIKKNIATQIAKYLGVNSIACTGTSGLSITSLAECYPDDKRGRFFGVHMFNPPYNMPLCEVICTKYSDESKAKELKTYLKDVLFRTVVEVNDSPAFLANRIGFQFINEALQYAETYKDNGGIDYIDSILGPFTGRAMAPLATADFVGLDVHKAIVDNLYNNTYDYVHEDFVFPEFANNLVSEKKLGRKSGEGLYKIIKYSNGLKRMTVYDINTASYRDVIPYAFPFADKMKKLISEGDYTEAFLQLIKNRSQEAEICLHFLLKYIIYSLYCGKEVAASRTAADDVMAMGFNWCPPIALYDAINEVTDVEDLIKQRVPDISEKIDIRSLLSGARSSKYDYRRYFKSGR